MMRYSWMRFIVLSVLLVGAGRMLAQDSSPSTPERVLAISTVPVLEPPLASDNAIERYVGAMDKADQAGAKGNLIAKRWNELEPEAGKYTLDDFSGDLNYRTATYNTIELVSFQILNTTAKEAPPDLQQVAFDSPEMIQRFQQFFDAFLPHLNEQVRYISIGNEVDAYLNAHPDEWKTYQQFYEGAVAYIHKTAPWIKVGVTATFSGTLTSYERVAELNRMSDVFIMTYYPLKDDFSVRPPDSPLADFPQMVKWAGDKPLILQEVGYPAAESLGSSEAAQSAFVQNVFKAWESDAAHIPFLSYFALGDFSDELCHTLMSYYGLPDQQFFYDYLCTLGLLKADGTPREAWQTFVDAGQKLTK